MTDTAEIRRVVETPHRRAAYAAAWSGWSARVSARRRSSPAVHGCATGRRWRADSLFRIASMTKPVTAVAAMMLVEDGKLVLDEPVDRLLPELANRRVLARIDAELDDTVPAKRPITVEDLLTFRPWDRHRPGAAGRLSDPARAISRTRPDGLRAARSDQPAHARTPGSRGLGRAAADGPAGRGLDVHHRLEHPGRADRAGVGPVATGVLRGAHLRAPGHERHRLPRPAGQDRPADQRLPVDGRRAGSVRRPEDRRLRGAARPARRRRGPGVDRRRLPRLLPVPGARRRVGGANCCRRPRSPP